MPSVVASRTKRPLYLREAHGQRKYPASITMVIAILIVPICESVALTSRTKNNGRIGVLSAIADIYTNFFRAKD